MIIFHYCPDYSCVVASVAALPNLYAYAYAHKKSTILFAYVLWLTGSIINHKVNTWVTPVNRTNLT